MVRMATVKQPKPYEIDKYLGLNEAVGLTEIKVGESIFQQNFRITKNLKFEKRPGHQTAVNFGVGNVQGIWQGTIGGDTIMLACHNGRVYRLEEGEF